MAEEKNTKKIDIGLNLKTIREKAGWSQEAVAAAISSHPNGEEVSQQTISVWESKKDVSELSEKNLELISLGLEMGRFWIENVAFYEWSGGGFNVYQHDNNQNVHQPYSCNFHVNIPPDQIEGMLKPFTNMFQRNAEDLRLTTNDRIDQYKTTIEDLRNDKKELKEEVSKYRKLFFDKVEQVTKTDKIEEAAK